jgi:homoserine dehydrogenase
MRYTRSGQPLDGEPVAIDRQHVREILADYPVMVVPGFFGTDASGRTQLLGRGGSDLTAVFLSVSLGAERCRLEKDRDGVYESDPAIADSHPRRFSLLNYTDALRVAGKLIQPKAVAYLQHHQAQAEVAALGLSYQTIVGRGDTVLARGTRKVPIDVAILGLGTVGFGVYQRLLSLPESVSVVGVLVRDRAKYIAAGVPSELLHTNEQTLRDLRPALVIDALTGVEPSGSILKSYLTQKVHVVSANKALIADRGASLELIAHTSGAALRYAAAVGGSVPMLELVTEATVRGDVESIVAVLNGTCNFVLDRCAEGMTLENAVAEAQRCGFAEMDPGDDLSGQDAGRKLQILVRGAPGVTLDKVVLQTLTSSIAQCANDVARDGMKLRQIARVVRNGTRLSASVEFEAVKCDSLFGRLAGEWNALELNYANGETVALRGRGAGRWPTTESVIADVLDIVRCCKDDVVRIPEHAGP